MKKIDENEIEEKIDQDDDGTYASEGMIAGTLIGSILSAFAMMFLDDWAMWWWIVAPGFGMLIGLTVGGQFKKKSSDDE